MIIINGIVITNAIVLCLVAAISAVVIAHYIIVSPPKLLKRGVEGKSNEYLILGVLTELSALKTARSSALILCGVSGFVLAILSISNALGDDGNNYLLSQIALTVFGSVCLAYALLVGKQYDKGRGVLDSIDVNVSKADTATYQEIKSCDSGKDI